MFKTFVEASLADLGIKFWPQNTTKKCYSNVSGKTHSSANNIIIKITQNPNLNENISSF